VWTGETIRLLRQSHDYKVLLSLLYAQYAMPLPKYRDLSVFSKNLSLFLGSAKVPETSSQDPDFNPTLLRALLAETRSSGVISPAALSALDRELTSTVSDRFKISEEEQLLPLSGTVSKVEFASFLRRHVSDAFDNSTAAPMAKVLALKVGGLLPLLPTALSTSALVDQSQLPLPLKTVLRSIGDGSALTLADFTQPLHNSLIQAGKALDEAKTTLESVSSSQTFDTISDDAELAKKAVTLETKTPSLNEVFDVLSEAANKLPISEAARTAVSEVADVGIAITSTVSTISAVSSSLATLSSIGSLGLSFLTTGGIGALAGSLGSIFGGSLMSSGPSNQDILDAVQKVDKDLTAMHKDMDDRFDRVDKELATLDNHLDTDFSSLSSQVADVAHNVHEIQDSTAAIETAVFEERVSLNREAGNELGNWDHAKLMELHDNVVELTDALRRADAGAPGLSKDDFRRLGLYFRIVAKQSATSSPLDGLETTSDDYSVDNLSARLDIHQLYPLNYLLQTPISGQSTLISEISGPMGGRDVASSPFINERAWAIASNALAAMLERFPEYAQEIPLADYDAIMTNGTDLQKLVSSIGVEDSSGGSQIFNDLESRYSDAVKLLDSALDAAVQEEAQSYASAQGLSASQISAISSGLSADGDPMVSYVPQNIDIVGCSLSLSATIGPNSLKSSFFGTHYQIALAAALNKLRFGGCLAPTGLAVTRSANLGHGGYHILSAGRDIGPVCFGTSVVTFVEGNAVVPIWASLSTDPDDAAHRYALGIGSGAGSETENTMHPAASDFRWSGFDPGPGFDNLNGICASLYNNNVGYNVATFEGDQSYYAANASNIASSLSVRPTISLAPQFSTNTIFDFDVAASQANQPDLNAIYGATISDLTDVLTNQPQSRLVGSVPTALRNAVASMQGARALLRATSNVAFENTLAKDDVLHGLLFGTDDIPAASEILDALQRAASAASSPEVTVEHIATFGSDRSTLLSNRIQEVLSEIQSRRIVEGHALLDQTLLRLARLRCLVPKDYASPADCDTRNIGMSPTGRQLVALEASAVTSRHLGLRSLTTRILISPRT